MRAPLDVDDERRLYPVIQRGRDAAHLLDTDDADDHLVRRRLLAPATRRAKRRNRSSCARPAGWCELRVLERGYRFGNEELEAAGVEGLVNALRRFDPRKGHEFSTYANYWIMKLVNQAIQQQVGSQLTPRCVSSCNSRSSRRAIRRRGSPSARSRAALGVSLPKANEVMQMNRDLVARALRVRRLR